MALARVVERLRKTKCIRAIAQSMRAIGATERDVDDVVARVVWPGPVMKWPRTNDASASEVSAGDEDARRARERFEARYMTAQRRGER